jgi:hypothetical protein
MATLTAPDAIAAPIPRVVLLVTGSRHCAPSLTFERLARELDAVCATLQQPVTEVIHGGAWGVDRMAGRWAQARQLPCTVYKPDWDGPLGTGAGLKRNEDMVAAATHVVGFWNGESRGTMHCIRTAERAGKLLGPIHVFPLAPGAKKTGTRKPVRAADIMRRVKKD